MKTLMSNLVKNALATLKNYLFSAAVLLAIIASAVGVANSTYKSRAYMYDLQKLEAEQQHLQVEWGQLLLEQHTWGSYARIGRIAVEHLQMRNPAATEIIMVRQ